MSNVFKVLPRMIPTLSPMEPQKIKDTYMRIYQFDYKKANCHQTVFNFVALD